MKLTLKRTGVYFIALFALGFFAALWVLSIAQKVDAGAPSGLPASQAVATTTTVGPANNDTLIFAATTRCNSRIVRTQGQEIILLFDEPTNGDLASSTNSFVAGFVQLASTTVAYDSGIYGCGRLTGYASASTSITAAEFR